MGKISIALVALACFFMSACEKYLDAKTANDITVPSTVVDCQRLLDNSIVMNRWMTLDGEASGDNIWMSQTQLDAWGGNYITHLYWWGDDIYFSSETSNFWVNAYSAVEVTNIVLKTLNTVKRIDGDQLAFDNAKGSALFYRAYCFEKLLALYAKGYNDATKNSDLGIALRMTEDFNVPSVRSNVKDSYDQVIKDFSAALPLLPATSVAPARPSKQAVYGALAEVYLTMHDYEKAGEYSDSCLRINNTLLDYNDFDTTSITPFVINVNKEVVFLAGADGSLISAVGYYNIDSSLYASYEKGDLRRGLFFSPNQDNITYSFKGGYYPDFYYFSGIAVDEMYLIRAECRARAGEASASISDLNLLLEKRYVRGSFTPYSTTDAKQALNIILNERRKELVFREFRWNDIKRLNLEGADISITHFANDKTYILPPNDNKFAVALPYRDIKISGMQQNPR